MSAVFGDYARYYDLLYRDKDYAGEAAIIRSLMERHQAPAPARMLDLGCGTGVHAELLAGHGHRVSGVDLSAGMLEEAERRRARLPAELAERLDFTHGDVRTVRLGRRFDVVVALFHVLSYQTGNEDVAAMLETARQHLEPGGLFVFDFWYGPAVLTDRPTARTKRLEDDALLVVREAAPAMDARRNLVEVRYRVSIHDKRDGSDHTLSESHLMRYLFEPELELMLNQAGFSILSCFEWGSDRTPGYDTWNVCCVARLT